MKSKLLYIILFSLTCIFLFSFMIQEHFKIFEEKKLYGKVVEVEMPEFTMENYVTGSCQRQLESYISNNFGFRPGIVRLYNQYVWDFYRKFYVDDVVRGKDDWLYYKQNVNDYYNTEMYRWQDTPQDARERYDQEVELMIKLRGILKEYGKEFFVFMAPEKGFVYSEYLPDRAFDTIAINARKYYSHKFDSVNFPYIEMTEWFLQMKDTVSYPIFPQLGAHWNFSCVYAADSLFHFMADLKGIKLPEIEIGELRKTDYSQRNHDNDLASLLNLLRPIDDKKNILYDADVTVVSDSTCEKPNVLFIGNSFLWRIKDYVPLDQVFNNWDFWFYNSTAYRKNGNMILKVSEIDRLADILNADYIVWFTTGNQMYKTSYGFVEDALIKLCFPDDVFYARCDKLADSICKIPSYREKYISIIDDSVKFRYKMRMEASKIIKDSLEIFPEFRGNGVPTARNPEIKRCMIKNQIENDPDWFFTLSCISENIGIKKELLIQREIDSVINNKKLYRDMDNDRLLYIQSKVKEIEAEIRSNPDKMKAMKKKSVAQKKTLDQTIHDDAVWIVNNKIENKTLY